MKNENVLDKTNKEYLIKLYSKITIIAIQVE